MAKEKKMLNSLDNSILVMYTVPFKRNSGILFEYDTRISVKQKKKGKENEP